jgi:undecaprenyl diphosphate synthase
MIMDRNGEWAKKRGLSRVMGHREGIKAIKRVVRAAGELNIKVLSLFAFSTENWLRPKDEVSFLMKLMEEYIAAESEELLTSGVRVVVSGRLDRIPASTAKAAEGIIERSATNDKMTLNIALDYGGQDEIVQAAAKIAKAVATGDLDINNLDTAMFRNFLWHPELPDIDLLIRTGQEQRISNFMLWQLAYAELYFTPVLWPDFGKDELAMALEDFKGRKRRFGMTQEQIDKV